MREAKITVDTDDIDAKLIEQRADLDLLRADLDMEKDETNADIASLEAELIAAVGRIEELESADPKPDPEPDPEPDPIPPPDPAGRTENEKKVLEAATPWLAYDTPGPDTVTPGDGKWWGVADLVSHPEYESTDGVFGSILAADRAWAGNGRPADGGICFMPGHHIVKNLGTENFFRNVRRVRAQDKTRETIIDGREGWQRTDFVLAHTSDFVLTLEGFEVRGAYGKNRKANVGANSGVDSRLVLIEMVLRGGDNGIRTTGRSVAMFRTRMIGNARSDQAHGAYLSNDNRRGVHTPVVVAVDCVSVDNAIAHAFKTRAKVLYIRGGTYEGQYGFAIDNSQGAAALIEGAEIIQKTPTKQWVVVAHGLDKCERDTGFARGDYFHRQHLLTNVWKGRSTFRDDTFRNEHQPGFAGIWNDAKYRMPMTDENGDPMKDGDNFLYDPDSEVFVADPVEIINCTVDGAALTTGDVRGPVEIL